MRPALAAFKVVTAVGPYLVRRLLRTWSPRLSSSNSDYDVYVSSNQPDRDATASDASDTWSHETDSTGSAVVYLWYQSPGESITVTVGGATCYTTA